MAGLPDLPAMQRSSSMPDVRIRPMTPDDAARVAGWQYPDRWSVYDLPSSSTILDELDSYWAVTDGEDTLVGFVCEGSAARVDGLTADQDVVDVGVGMDPDLVGQGGGRVFGNAVLAHFGRHHPGRPLRAVIQSWNVRSQRFAAALGFAFVGELTQGGQRTAYRILLKPAAESEGVVVTRSLLGAPEGPD